MSARHLVRRFFGSLRPGGPSPVDEAWARSHLLAGERSIWDQLSSPDRRHAVGVARQVTVRLGDGATRPVLAAALLHDSGKVVSGLGTFARVGATLLGPRRARGRAAEYLRHPEHGATLLRDAGSDALTIAWAAEHHQPPDRWSLDRRLAEALKAADDD